MISGSKKSFFRHCSCETQTSPALQKSNFSGSKKLLFFVCLLSNLPTPPRYLALARSKLRRCMQNITKNALRIWGALGLSWWKFACIKKYEFEGPWASSFQILNHLSGCNLPTMDFSTYDQGAIVSHIFTKMIEKWHVSDTQVIRKPIIAWVTFRGP